MFNALGGLVAMMISSWMRGCELNARPTCLLARFNRAPRRRSIVG
jgi:hypothetical protein